MCTRKEIIKQKKMRQSIKKDKRVNVQKIILTSLAVVGLVSVAVLAPNALQMLRMFNGKNKRYKSPYYVRSVIKKLKEKGLIVFQKTKKGTFVRLTEKGKQELLRYQIKDGSLKRKKWDKKWRIIIFDIKEYKRGVRGKIRRQLESFGFVKLQNSVWVYPYNCEEVMILLKADFHIGKEVLYIVAENIENDKWLKQYFDL